MRSCWGVTTLLPEDFAATLTKATTYSYHPYDGKSDVLLLAGLEGLRRALPTLKGTNIAVVVFDVKESLDKWSIPLLDLSKPIRAQLKKSNELRLKRRDPIKRLLNKTARSFVSNFSTFVYKTKDPEKQKSLRQAVLSALWNNRRVAFSAKVHKKSEELIGLLASEDAANLEAALQEVRKGRPIHEVSKEFKIASFDINYVLKFLENN